MAWLSALSEVAPRYRALFCDLWGCLHDGKRPFPGAVAALEAFRASGGAVVLLTNAPRSAGAVAAQLAALGVPRGAWDLIVTSGEAAQYAYLSGAVGQKVFHIGAEKDESFFADIAADLVPKGAPPVTRVPLAEAEGLIVTGLRDDLTEVPEDYRAPLLAAKVRGLPLLCANPDLVADLGERRLYCAGALAALYEDMGGQTLYFGKPHPPIYDLARRRLAALKGPLADDDILCIGDGIGTDIRGGVAEGLDTLFITGGLAAAELGGNPAAPDREKLAAYLGKAGLSPTHVMGLLA